MKPELSEVQIFFIENKLTELGLAYLPLKEEYLDHICCQVENELVAGQTFQQATHVVFEVITKDELKKLQQQTIFFTNQKSRRMKNVMSVFTLSIVLMTGFFFFLKKEKELSAIQPPAPDEMMTLQDDLFSKEKNATTCKEHFHHEKNETNPSIPVHDPPSIAPLKGNHEVTSNFGMRLHPLKKKRQFHRGMDFKAPIGTPVLATANGMVEQVAKHKNGYGNHIVIKHDEAFKTLYAHLSEIKISKGQKVEIGDVIGLVGTTGAAIASHLHYEVIKSGKAVDPMAYCNP